MYTFLSVRDEDEWEKVNCKVSLTAGLHVKLANLHVIRASKSSKVAADCFLSLVYAIVYIFYERAIRTDISFDACTSFIGAIELNTRLIRRINS